MYYDEDGDLAHEFYEETMVTKNGKKKSKLKRIQKNLIPQVSSFRKICILLSFRIKPNLYYENRSARHKLTCLLIDLYFLASDTLAYGFSLTVLTQINVAII